MVEAVAQLTGKLRGDLATAAGHAVSLADHRRTFRERIAPIAVRGLTDPLQDGVEGVTQVVLQPGQLVYLLRLVEDDLGVCLASGLAELLPLDLAQAAAVLNRLRLAQVTGVLRQDGGQIELEQSGRSLRMTLRSSVDDPPVEFDGLTEEQARRMLYECGATMDQADALIRLANGG